MSWAPLQEHFNQSDGQLHPRMYRLWIGWLESETVAIIKAAAKSPRVRTTSRVPTVQARRDQRLKVRCEYDEEQLGQNVEGSNPGAGKFFHLLVFEELNQKKATATTAF